MNGRTLPNRPGKPPWPVFLRPNVKPRCRSAFGLAALLFALVWPVQAERVSEADAKAAAQGWITVISQVRGQWGGSPQAQVEAVFSLKQGNRVLGYFCPVRPRG